MMLNCGRQCGTEVGRRVGSAKNYRPNMSYYNAGKCDGENVPKLLENVLCNIKWQGGVIPEKKT
jgi:hypothetical protein